MRRNRHGMARKGGWKQARKDGRREGRRRGIDAEIQHFRRDNRTVVG